MREMWHPIVGFETRYAVSNLGRIKSLPRVVQLGFKNRGTINQAEGFLAPSLIKGSRRVSLYDGIGTGTRQKCVRYAVSRLVWVAFNGPIPPGMVIRLVDLDHDNCALDNLECVTRAELINHSRINQLL